MITPEDDEVNIASIGNPRFSLGPATSAQIIIGDPKAEAHKRDMELRDKTHQHEKEIREDQRRAIMQLAAMILILAVGLACIWVIVSNKYSQGTVDKSWVALTVILSGFVGFVVGQNVKK